ncbi:uncharacterized protein LOC132193017 [Neocloeon triangulifer]|uniref:uncharacterized protein LOC132193017 n=1 Tax=Neocloeon triangulifer TaxID=2078957 RepID=UPI00286EED60|nr:uncharacterized protein LOC132193017 [Neocloeon triangulifer]
MASRAILLAALLVAVYLAHNNEAKVVKKDRARRGVVAVAPLAIVQKRRDREEQDLTKIPGVPGVDYPLFRSVPPTHFDCSTVPAHPGMYANVETGCQAYHVCHDGREGRQGAAFLCPNGTLFNQKEFACDWWYNVDCPSSITLYSLNLDPAKNPYFPKPQKNLEVVHV